MCGALLYLLAAELTFPSFSLRCMALRDSLSGFSMRLYNSLTLSASTSPLDTGSRYSEKCRVDSHISWGRLLLAGRQKSKIKLNARKLDQLTVFLKLYPSLLTQH